MKSRMKHIISCLSCIGGSSIQSHPHAHPPLACFVNVVSRLFFVPRSPSVVLMNHMYIASCCCCCCQASRYCTPHCSSATHAALASNWMVKQADLGVKRCKPSSTCKQCAGSMRRCTLMITWSDADECMHHAHTRSPKHFLLFIQCNDHA